MSSRNVISLLDEVVNDFVHRTRFFKEDFSQARARMFVKQHRLNSRQRNSVLKLRVATNCPIWDIKLNIISACTQEIIADDEHGGGKPHWKILEDLGVRIGMKREEIAQAEPLPSTRLAWYAWEGLMSNRHWLEGLIANTCAERPNIPGYGSGLMKKAGWFGLERERWKQVFPDLSDADLDFFELHTEADKEHSDLGWNTVAEYAEKLGMSGPIVDACRENLLVWEHYLNGIGDAADGRR